MNRYVLSLHTNGPPEWVRHIVHDLLHNVVTGYTSIHKEQILVVKSSICEPLGFIDALVQAYNCRHVVLAEVAEVGFWSMLWVAYGTSPTTGSTMAI